MILTGSGKVRSYTFLDAAVDVGGDVRRTPPVAALVAAVVVLGFLIPEAVVLVAVVVAGLEAVDVLDTREPVVVVVAGTFLVAVELSFFWRTAGSAALGGVVAPSVLAVAAADDVFLRALAAVGAVNRETNDRVLTAAFFVLTSLSAGAPPSWVTGFFLGCWESRATLGTLVLGLGLSLSSSAFAPLLVVVVAGFFFNVDVGFLKPALVAFFLSAAAVVVVVVAAVALRGWPMGEAPGALSLGCFLLTCVSLMFSLTWLLSPVTLEFLDESLLLPLDGVLASVSVLVVVGVVEMGSAYKRRKMRLGLCYCDTA